MTGLLQFARQSLLGTILVLGSGKQTIELHEILIGNGGAFPLRTISLLQTGDIGVDMRIPGECFRIDKAHDWRRVAFGFADCAAAVVMDCRLATRLVKEECQYILENHPHKAVFVVPPLDEHAPPRPNAQAHLAAMAPSNLISGQPTVTGTQRKCSRAALARDPAPMVAGVLYAPPTGLWPAMCGPPATTAWSGPILRGGFATCSSTEACETAEHTGTRSSPDSADASRP